MPNPYNEFREISLHRLLSVHPCWSTNFSSSTLFSNPTQQSFVPSILIPHSCLFLSLRFLFFLYFFDFTFLLASFILVEDILTHYHSPLPRLAFSGGAPFGLSLPPYNGISSLSSWTAWWPPLLFLRIFMNLLVFHLLVLVSLPSPFLKRGKKASWQLWNNQVGFGTPPVSMSISWTDHIHALDPNSPC